jgi:hypothetical protein
MDLLVCTHNLAVMSLPCTVSVHAVCACVVSDFIPLPALSGAVDRPGWGTLGLIGGRSAVGPTRLLPNLRTVVHRRRNPSSIHTCRPWALVKHTITLPGFTWVAPAGTGC